MPIPDLSGKVVCVLDAHGIVYQVFHSLTGMSSSRGEPTGATFGFVRDVMTVIADLKADYVFCAFDMPGPTFRHELYTPYKANRPPMPDDLRTQLGFIKDFTSPLGIASLGLSGYEADDLLATLARQTTDGGGRAVLVTADKDARQLITENVSLYNLRKQQLYTAKELLQDWGIRPDQVVDFQTLVGDATDNVPGVPLIGPKSAAELLVKYDTLEGVFAHVEELTGKKKENLKAARETTDVSRRLVKLKDDVPIEINWEDGRFHGVDVKGLRLLFNYFGFRSLVPKADLLATQFGELTDTVLPSYAVQQGTFVPAEPQSAATVSPSETDDEAEKLFRCLAGDEADPKSSGRAIMPISDMNAMLNTFYETLPPTLGLAEELTCNLVDTEELLDSFLEELGRQSIFSVDLETTSVHPRAAQIVGIAISFDTATGWYIPIMGPLGSECLDLAFVLERLRPCLESQTIGKVGQNIKYDMIVFRNAGIQLRGVLFDTMVADYLLRTGERNHNLDDMAEFYLNYETVKIDALIGSGKNQKKMNEVPTDVVADYAGEDAYVAWALFPILLRELKKDSRLMKLMTEVELPLVEVLADMEYEGIRIDPSGLRSLARVFQDKIDLTEKQIRDAVHQVEPNAGFADSFNLNSPLQLQRILFDDLHLPVIRRTKTGRSTDIEVLEELAPLHPLPNMIIQHRQLTKLQNTYVVPLVQLAYPATGRIHASFNQVVTATGRLSSSDPNLQNIPIRSEEGRLIRTGFVPDATRGFDTIVSCDYSQIELRVLAHFSRDKHMTEAFAADEDIHTHVASRLFDVPLDMVTSEMRRKAKAVNFGLVYGQSAFGLSKAISIPRDEAAAYIRSFFETYSGIQDFFDRVLFETIEHGYASTILGRKRKIDGVRRKRPSGQLNEAERTAINTVIQGSAADLMKLAMVRVFRRLHDAEHIAPTKADMLLQIHDELVLETSNAYADELSELVVTLMRMDDVLSVPLKVDVETGPTWGDLK
ncbi:MAG: DNA polymerase I [Thermoguttaceae bacterium]|nr:DNA polymerase I [Thermoguttaceae bacterium]